MTWVNLVLALVQVANKIFAYLHDSKLIKAGEDKQVAAALTEMAKRSTTLREIEEKFGAMPMAGIADYLSREGDYRD